MVSPLEANLLLEVEKYYNTKIDEMPKDLAEVEKELS
jgi:translation initiation factor 4A